MYRSFIYTCTCIYCKSRAISSKYYIYLSTCFVSLKYINKWYAIKQEVMEGMSSDRLINENKLQEINWMMIRSS